MSPLLTISYLFDSICIYACTVANDQCVDFLNGNQNSTHHLHVINRVLYNLLHLKLLLLFIFTCIHMSQTKLLLLKITYNLIIVIASYIL